MYIACFEIDVNFVFLTSILYLFYYLFYYLFPYLFKTLKIKDDFHAFSHILSGYNYFFLTFLPMIPNVIMLYYYNSTVINKNIYDLLLL